MESNSCFRNLKCFNLFSKNSSKPAAQSAQAADNEPVAQTDDGKSARFYTAKAFNSF